MSCNCPQPVPEPKFSETVLEMTYAYFNITDKNNQFALRCMFDLYMQASMHESVEKAICELKQIQGGAE